MRALTDPETGDPAIEDLQRALGPAPPQGYLSVMIAAEDVLVHREWNVSTAQRSSPSRPHPVTLPPLLLQRSYGWLYEPRAGLKDLLRHLVDPSNPVMVTLWSENNSNVAAEMTEKLMHEVGGPPAHTPPLSVEHMFLRAATGSTAAPGSKRKEKRLEYFNRDRQSMLLIDKDPVSEQLNPHNTILVTAMGAGAAGNAGADTTCAAIRAVVQRVRDDAALSGIVNVPRTLHNLRQEAVAAGYSTDAAGLHMYLVASAEEEVERERQRREAGLGGLMRRAAATNPILKSKMTTNEAAMLRDFRDPAIELGPDALLASKVREATQKMFQR